MTVGQGHVPVSCYRSPHSVSLGRDHHREALMRLSPKHLHPDGPARRAPTATTHNCSTYSFGAVRCHEPQRAGTQPLHISSSHARLHMITPAPRRIIVWQRVSLPYVFPLKNSVSLTPWPRCWTAPATGSSATLLTSIWMSRPGRLRKSSTVWRKRTGVNWSPTKR